MQRNKAKNELAQHLAEDPLPLRKAKITQEAAVKKTERAAVAAEAAAQEAARAKEAAEAAFAEASKRVEEAEAYLEKAKNSLPHGGVWWMERELHEAKAYLPKGGFNPGRNKPRLRAPPGPRTHSPNHNNSKHCTLPRLTIIRLDRFKVACSLVERRVLSENKRTKASLGVGGKLPATKTTVLTWLFGSGAFSSRSGEEDLKPFIRFCLPW